MNIQNTIHHKTVIQVFALVLILGISILAFHYVRLKESPSTDNPDTNLGQYTDKNQTISAAGTTPTPPVAPLIPVKGCALDLVLTPSLATAASGDQITYLMNLKNNGDTTCTDASISVYYSDNEQFVSSDIAPSSSNYYWKIGDLASLDQKNFKIVTKAQENTSTDINTEACASADNGDDSCPVNDVIISGKSTPFTKSPITTPVVSSVPKISVPTIPVPVLSSSTSQEYGIWVWVPPTQMSDAYMNSLISDARANGINVLYVTIDDYLTAQSDSEKDAFSKALENLIIKANNQNIAVDAEAGDRDWAEDWGKNKAFTIIDYVMEFNIEHPDHPLRGFQYDVESYLLPSYENDKAPILTDFVSLIDQTVSRLGNSNIRFAVVIPHFYDSVQAWTPAITYKGISAYTFDHLLRILDTRSGSSMIIMAYRNFAEGDNSTIDLSKTEITEASEGTHQTKIIVGQETGNVEPSYVTFYGKTKQDYLDQIAIVKDYFKNYAGFGGMAVHYIDSFRELK